jgi:hypothetical protein
LILVAAAGVAYEFFWVPGTALFSDGAEVAGLEQGLVFAAFNVVWAPANLLGATLGGLFAEATGEAGAFLLVAALCVVSLAGVQVTSGPTHTPGQVDPNGESDPVKQD